jgi:hypothetical protein
MALLTLLNSLAIWSFWKRAGQLTLSPLLIELDDFVDALEFLWLAAALFLRLSDHFGVASFFFSEEVNV